ncbi:MAG: hypothetical protein ACRDOD_17430 [Streptosporangiaceae bacterium]
MNRACAADAPDHTGPAPVPAPLLLAVVFVLLMLAAECGEPRIAARRSGHHEMTG